MGSCIKWKLWSTEQHIGHTSRILGNHRQRPCAASVSLRSEPLKYIIKPAANFLHDAVICVMALRVAVRGCIPVCSSEQLIRKDSRVSKSKRAPVPKRDR